MRESLEILRLVDTITRSKEIEKEVVFQGIEAALLSAARKKLGESELIEVTIDRDTGEYTITDDGQPVETEELGRLAAMAGKQVLFQKIREAERDRIFDEYESKLNKLVTGVVHRYEGANIIVDLGKVEGFLPRSEQAPGERFKVGERIKVLIKDLRKNTNRVKVVLSRTSREIVRCLFELEVPEIADKVIEIKEIAREPGYRTKIAVTTHDPNVDCVGACVGVRGSRIKNIVDELFGEKIDIVRWNESIEILIMNALKPAEIASKELDFDSMAAKIFVKPEQQSLAIGKRGQNVRLASKLTGWQLDIEMITDEQLERMRRGDYDDEDEGDEVEGDEDAGLEDDEEFGDAVEEEGESEGVAVGGAERKNAFELALAAAAADIAALKARESAAAELARRSGETEDSESEDAGESQTERADDTDDSVGSVDEDDADEDDDSDTDEDAGESEDADEAALADGRE